MYGGSVEIVIAGNPESEDTSKMLDVLNRSYYPGKVVLLRPDGENPPISRIAGYTLRQNRIDNKATAYICRNFICDNPTTDISKLVDALRI
jgi:uncharacterized protein YyaL (SSP411 family)